MGGNGFGSAGLLEPPSLSGFLGLAGEADCLLNLLGDNDLVLDLVHISK